VTDDGKTLVTPTVGYLVPTYIILMFRLHSKLAVLFIDIIFTMGLLFGPSCIEIGMTPVSSCSLFDIMMHSRDT